MRHLTLFLRLAFWATLAFSVIMALLPQPPKTPIDGFGDKAEHMLAFGTLAFLGAFAYPRMPLPRLGERLSFLGALVEVAQSIPALHRDCDIRDWLADTAAIALVLLLTMPLRHRLARKRAGRAREA